MGSFSFLFPAMLGALGAASVPIIIHILHRLRSRTVEFPTNRFLRQATVPSHRRPDPLNWLILFLRVCFVALLAMGLAGMVYDHSAGDDSSKGISRAILLDNSFSMTARSGKRPRFDAAREVASSLADSMRPRERDRPHASSPSRSPRNPQQTPRFCRVLQFLLQDFQSRRRSW